MILPTDIGMISLFSPQTEHRLPWRQGTWWAPRRLWWDGGLGAPHTSWENTPVIQAGSGPLLLEPEKKDRWQWQQSSDRDRRVITSVCQQVCHTVFALITVLWFLHWVMSRWWLEKLQWWSPGSAWWLQEGRYWRTWGCSVLWLCSQCPVETTQFFLKYHDETYILCLLSGT